MLKSKLFTVAFAACVLFTAFEANAGNVTYNGLGFKKNVKIQHYGSQMNVAAGQILLTYEGKDYEAFCVDMDHVIKNSWTGSFEPISFLTNGLAAAYLYDTYAADVSSDLEGAALQVAIWEVIDDFGGTLDVTSGNFQLLNRSDVGNLAQSMLDAMPQSLNNYSTNAWIIESGEAPRSQHQIVPEPGALLLMATALPLFLTNKRR